MPSEADVQRTIIDALVWDGWLVIRVNQGGRHSSQKCPNCGLVQKAIRYIRFAWWQVLGMVQQAAGIADVIAVKQVPTNNPACAYHDRLELLAIEVKAPGKKKNVSHAQAHFLDAIESHGGIAIVADDLSDIAPYLDRVQVE